MRTRGTERLPGLGQAPYLRQHPGEWINSAAIERLTFDRTDYIASNAARRLRQLLGGAAIVYAHDMPGMPKVPKGHQAWYSNAETTPEARKRLPWSKCCNHAEVIWT